jgi:hypothetical protein
MKHILEYAQWVVNEGKVLTPNYHAKGIEIMKGLIDRGFTVNQAAGLVGNMFQESDLNHKNVADNGAFGLLQWLSTRKKAEWKYEGINDKTASNTSLAKQLDFIKQETTGAITYPDGHADSYEKGRWNAAVSAVKKGITGKGLKSPDTPSGWAVAIDEYYVRSGGSALEVRKDSATKLAEEYNKLALNTNVQAKPQPVQVEPINKLPIKPAEPIN